MKKIFTIAAVSALLGPSLVSCNTDGENTITYNYTATAYNLYTPLDGSESHYIQSANYELKILAHEYNVVTTANGMAIPGGGKVDFQLKKLSYELYTGAVDNKGVALYKFGAANATEIGASVDDFSAYFTQSCFVPETISALNLPITVPNVSGNAVGFAGLPFYFISNYKLDNRWLVRTFWPDQTFDGTTTMNSNGTVTDNKSMRYRVIMKTDASGVIGNVADVVIYNAKFVGDDAKSLGVAVVLKNLNLEFSSQGWTVTGTNIEGQTVTNNKLEFNPDYKFDNFSATASGDMTNMNCAYTFNDDTSVNFTGSYLVRPGDAATTAAN